jgi:acetyl esterase/lipase
MPEKLIVRLAAARLVAVLTLVLLLGAAARGMVTVESNLVYGTAVNYAGSNVALTLDAYYVSGAQSNRPVMILAHGGGFGGGDKGYTAAQGNFYPDLATAFATNGFVAFSINYRLWPGCAGGCPEEIDMAVADVMTALDWIRAHRADFGVQAERVLIGGDSAGGGLAINAAYRGTNAGSFLGCISLWGGVPPYGSEVHPVNTSPITPQTPPTCLVHGTADTIVPYAISTNLAAQLAAAGIHQELHPLIGREHYPVMAGGIYDTNLVAEIINHMIAFAQMTASTQPTAPLIRLGGQTLHVANDQFIFDITGPTNLTVVVERSQNLKNLWQPLATNQLLEGATWFTNAVSGASQFYRARMISP